MIERLRKNRSADGNAGMGRFVSRAKATAPVGEPKSSAAEGDSPGPAASDDFEIVDEMYIPSDAQEQFWKDTQKLLPKPNRDNLPSGSWKPNNGLYHHPPEPTMSPVKDPSPFLPVPIFVFAPTLSHPRCFPTGRMPCPNEASGKAHKTIHKGWASRYGYTHYRHVDFRVKTYQCHTCNDLLFRASDPGVMKQLEPAPQALLMRHWAVGVKTMVATPLVQDWVCNSPPHN